MLVPFVRSEANGHLGHNACEDSTETLVETQRRLAFYNFGASLDEPALWRLQVNVRSFVAFRILKGFQLGGKTYTRHARSLRKLHSDFDGVCESSQLLRDSEGVIVRA